MMGLVDAKSQAVVSGCKNWCVVQHLTDCSRKADWSFVFATDDEPPGFSLTLS